MEYQKKNETCYTISKFRRRNWVKTDDESRGRYNVSNQIKI